MGTALVAYVDRDQRTIELDPAVRVGARLDGGGEALLLHTTTWGHCGETAHSLARQLREAGWTVRVRALDEFAPLVSTQTKAGLVATAVAALDGDALSDDHDQPAAEAEPEPVSPSRWRNRTRRRCRVCGHLTMGRGVRSHVTNLGHDDWETVTLNQDGTYAPAQAQA